MNFGEGISDVFLVNFACATTIDGFPNLSRFLRKLFVEGVDGWNPFIGLFIILFPLLLLTLGTGCAFTDDAGVKFN